MLAAIFLGYRAATPAGAPVVVHMSNKKSPGNLALRLATSAPWVVFIIYMLFYGPLWIFPVVVGGIGVMCAHELFTMVAPASPVLRGYGVLATTAVYATVVVPGGEAGYLLMPTLAVLVGMLLNLAMPEPVETSAQRIGWTVAGPLYIGVLLGLLAKLLTLPHGNGWVMLTLTSAFLSDTGGYFAGRAFGKHKLAPRVSPKKTWEGTAGGLGGALVGALAAHFGYMPSLPLHHAIIAALCAAAVGQAGDLCESLIKRSTGVKDSGATLPGHGGFLDRTDAMMFCAGVMWIYANHIL